MPSSAPAAFDDMKSITGRESNLTILTLFGSLIVLMARKTAPQQD